MIISNRRFTVGADPEVFLKKKGTVKNYFWCSEGVIPGTKEKPFKVKDGAIQVDGFAAEFNIEPCVSSMEFLRKIRNVLRQLKQRVEKKGFDIYSFPVAKFTKKHYDSVPDKAKDLGCDPDFNAYTGKINPPPTLKNERIRTGSGHVHVGWDDSCSLTGDENHKEACHHLVKHLDQCLGKPLSYTYPDNERKELYGDFGAYRMKPFGVEYRTPSNIWLNDPRLVVWVFNQTKMAIENAFESTNYNYYVKPAPEVL